MPTCWVLEDGRAHSGRWNMALDEALLNWAVSEQQGALRLYRWQEPTVSLGYFQDGVDTAIHPELASLPSVKRLSGGGAILHHHEWTYACALPAEHPWTREPTQMYDWIHAALIGVLAEYGVESRPRGPVQEDSPVFLCFGRQDPHDVVLAGHKIIGSAQRRRKGAVLQHGSLLWERSPYAPQYPGLLDLVSAPQAAKLGADFAAEFPQKLLRALAACTPQAVPGTLPDGILEQVEVRVAEFGGAE